MKTKRVTLHMMGYDIISKTRENKLRSLLNERVIVNLCSLLLLVQYSFLS